MHKQFLHVQSSFIWLAVFINFLLYNFSIQDNSEVPTLSLGVTVINYKNIQSLEIVLYYVYCFP